MTTQATPHPRRAEVLDRAIAKNHKITDDNVNCSAVLRAVAIDFVQTYKGKNEFVQDIAVKLVDRGTLSIGQLRGALNVAVAEERARREAIVAELEKGLRADHPEEEQGLYLDLRSRKDREREDAGDVPEGSQESARVPNGTYTVILDQTLDIYRTIRLKDAPEHFNAAPGTQIGYFLSGPSNEDDYTGFAFVAGKTYRLWKKYQNNAEVCLSVQALDRLLSSDPMVHAREYVLRSGNCFVCGRKLTTPASIRDGIGPVCKRKLEAQGYTFSITADDRAAARKNAQDKIEELFAA